MSPIIYQISVALILHLLFLYVAGDGGDTNAYQAFALAGLPSGLLPQGVASFNFDRNSAQFNVHLGTNPCSLAIDNSFGVKYESQLTGTLSENKLGTLKGISLKVGNSVFQDVVQVDREVNEIKFTTGQSLTAKFPVQLFSGVRSCS